MINKQFRLYLVKVNKTDWTASKQSSLSEFKSYINKNFKEQKIIWGTLLIGKSAEEKSLELNINFDTTVKSLCSNK